MPKTDYEKLGREMVVLGTYDDYDTETIISVLRAADDLYYNDEQSFLEDNEYDALYRYAEQLEPHHSYFTGVGAEVRGGKVKLPYPMGSLDQVYEGEITDWVGKWQLQDEQIVVTDKLDGTSALLVYGNDGNLQIAYSRGDGVEGADITRHIKKFHTVPQNIGKGMVVRGEVIIPKATFEHTLKQKVLSRSGKPYKNPRNMVAGLMNAEKNQDIVYQHVHFVAYDIINFDGNKSTMLDELCDAGFLTPVFAMHFKGHELNDDVLSKHLNQRRQGTIYEIDGIVIDVDDISKRKKMNPTRDTLNPAFAVKYKVADADNQAITKVVGVEWNVSKHGYLKPKVKLEPVDLVGVTIQHATGFNAKFIKDNGVGPGAEVQITRSGDVIPFIQRVTKSATPQMPGGEWEWNDTRVDAIMMNHEEHEEVMIQQTLNFFRTLDIPHLKEGSIRSMFKQNHFDDTVSAIVSMVNYPESEWKHCIGQNGVKIHKGLHEKLNNIPLYKLMGASPFFGRGVGVRKCKKLLSALKVQSFQDLKSLTKRQIVSVESFEDKTATKIVNGIDAFVSFAQQLGAKVTFEIENASGSMQGQKVVMTGFRDKELQSKVEQEGGTVQSAVSSKTTLIVAKDPTSTSGKLKKAHELGIQVIGIDEFQEMMS